MVETKVPTDIEETLLPQFLSQFSESECGDELSLRQATPYFASLAQLLYTLFDRHYRQSVIVAGLLGVGTVVATTSHRQ